MKGGSHQFGISKPWRNKKNKFINEVYIKANSLRMTAFNENSLKWFYRMNDFCIWVGSQLEYMIQYENIDEGDLSEAIISE